MLQVVFLGTPKTQLALPPVGGGIGKPAPMLSQVGCRKRPRLWPADR
jgi:hypothetical protein